MQMENSSVQAHEYYVPPAENTASEPGIPALDDFKAHLVGTGKICPRPWCWKRFFILFNPGHEPPWLSAWWVTSAREKKDIFLKQLEYLAWHTDHFHAACRFLHEMDQDNWLFKSKSDSG